MKVLVPGRSESLGFRLISGNPFSYMPPSSSPSFASGEKNVACQSSFLLHLRTSQGRLSFLQSLSLSTYFMILFI